MHFLVFLISGSDLKLRGSRFKTWGNVSENIPMHFTGFKGDCF